MFYIENYIIYYRIQYPLPDRIGGKLGYY